MTDKEKELIDGVTFSVVGDLLPTSIAEGKVEDADYIAHVLWVPQTNKLIFKIWNKDGSIADPADDDFDERFPFDIVSYRGEKKADEEYSDIYTISATLYPKCGNAREVEYDGFPIYPAIKCIILDLIGLTNDDYYSSWH